MKLIYKTLDWGKNWLVDFSTRKAKLVLFYVKMDGSIHVERSSFKMLGLAFWSKLDWFIAKATSKEIGAMIHSMKFICLYKSTLRPCMENCCLRLGWCLLLLLGIFISYKSGSAGRLVLYLLPLLNPCLIFEM